MPQLDPTARSRRHRKVAAAVGLAVTAALTLGACSTASSADSDGPVADGQRVSIVASTNVWGSVAGAVAGDRADVVSIVSDPSADPHSYEASPATPPGSPTPTWSCSTVADTTGSSTTSSRAWPGKRTVDAFELYGSPTDLHGDHDAAAALARCPGGRGPRGGGPRGGGRLARRPRPRTRRGERARLVRHPHRRRGGAEDRRRTRRHRPGERRRRTPPTPPPSTASCTGSPR